MQAHDLLHRAGEQAKGIGVAQVGLLREGQFGDVGERPHILRRQAALAHAFVEQGDMVISALDDELQPLKLQVAQLRQRQKIRRTKRVETGG